MTVNYEVPFKDYITRVSTALQRSPFEKLDAIAHELSQARLESRWIYLVGNGGSASTASHFANDLVKGLSVDQHVRFRALALCDALPIMTALANDYHYDVVYSEQLKNFAAAGDILIAISGSGNSSNIIKAAEYAQEIGMKVISFTGRDGGNLLEHSDICCVSASYVMEEIEDIHMVWEHSLITILRSMINSEDVPAQEKSNE